MNAAPQWRYKEFKFELTKKADKSLDVLLARLQKYVLEAVTYFDIYKNSSAYTTNKTTFFYSADQFTTYVQISSSRRLFDSLGKYILMAEEDVDHIICMDQFNTLAENIENDDLSAIEKELVEKIRRYVSSKAVSSCAATLFLTLDNRGLSLSSYTDGFITFNHHSALLKGAEAVDAYILQLRSDADLYLKNLEAFIYENIDDFPEIKASACYKTSTRRMQGPIHTGHGGVGFF